MCGRPPIWDLLAGQLESGSAYWSLVRNLVEEPPTAPCEQKRAAERPDEPLTERNFTVLPSCSVDSPTRRSHVRNIYCKLSVGSRREAVPRARDLKLL